MIFRASNASKSHRWGLSPAWMHAALAALVALIVLAPESANACATCYGEPGSPLGKGLNWGVFALLTIVVMVLAGIASFFVFIAKRAASLSAAGAAEASPSVSEKI